jgi:hypothetical protein
MPKVPEAEVLRVCELVCRHVVPDFLFPGVEVEDVEQQARMEVWELSNSPKYDEKRPFVNFAFTHVRNRLFNFKRDNFQRSDSPCKLCQAGRSSEHTNQRECEAYAAWKKRGAAKRNLAKPVSVDLLATDPADESDVEGEAGLAEALALIDELLPVELRPAYLQMVAGQSVSRSKRNEVRKWVRGLLEERGAWKDEGGP